mmetsp:Transcript_918/g.2120  ORF Transcript_918/g.2120 Transcript_918/m.2120 type:complete len:83 (+) Transcript_918:1223-1471(+)
MAVSICKDARRWLNLLPELALLPEIGGASEAGGDAVNEPASTAPGSDSTAVPGSALWAGRPHAFSTPPASGTLHTPDSISDS